MFSKYKSKLFLIILLSGHLTAENLLDIYNEALENDPTFKAAEYSSVSYTYLTLPTNIGV